MALIDLLDETKPDWATVVERAEHKLIVDAEPRKLSGAPGQRYRLVVDTTTPAASVSEVASERILPPSCPERHINGDSTFCLGLNRRAILTPDDGFAFWLGLRGYLLAQQFAEKHKRWPPGRGLSHGRAADCQIEAEVAAQHCGLADEYAVALNYGEGWLAGTLPEIMPGSCNGEHSPTDDGACIVIDTDCGQCAAVLLLIAHERNRREAEIDFANHARMWRPCCNTMPNCPVRIENADPD